MILSVQVGAQQPVTLRVMAVSGHEAFNRSIEAQQEAFNEMYDNIQIDLEIVPASWPDFEERFTIMLAAGAAPDLVMGGAGAYAKFARAGIFVPLDDYIARDQLNLDDYFPGPLSAVVVDGTYYSLPASTSTRAVAYNRNMFEERGFAQPEMEWEWYADVLPIARSLTNREQEPHNYGLAFWVWHGAHHLGDIASIIWGHGGEILSEDETEFVLGSPESTEAMEFIIDLITTYQVFPDNFDALGHFMAGRLGMWFAGTWDAAILAGASFDVGWATQPAGPVADTATGGGGPSYSITSQSQHPDEAWEFIKFVTSAQGQIISGEMPSHRGAIDEYLRESPPYENREVFIHNLNRSRLVEWPEAMPEVYRILNEAGWQDMLTGEVPFRSWIQEVTPRVNRALQGN